MGFAVKILAVLAAVLSAAELVPQIAMSPAASSHVMADPVEEDPLQPASADRKPSAHLDLMLHNYQPLNIFFAPDAMALPAPLAMLPTVLAAPLPN